MKLGALPPLDGEVGAPEPVEGSAGWGDRSGEPLDALDNEIRAARHRAMIAEIAAALAEHGLILRGGFAFDSTEDPPNGPSGRPARSLLLVRQAGGQAWPHFRGWLAKQDASLAHPLDSWSRWVIGAVGERFGARAVSPSDRPYLPFQQWAMRAEGLRPSPLGILMHPEFGLWHAYRGALLFDTELAIPEARKADLPCDRCTGKPCLSACPAGAFSAAGFTPNTCLGHLAGPDGEPCMKGGCLARNACPVGAAYRYPAESQVFHMASFAGPISRAGAKGGTSSG